MNIAQARPQTWTPQIVLISLLVHAVVLYYVAVAFQVVPPIVPTTIDPPTIQTVTLPPPPPQTTPDTDNTIVQGPFHIDRPTVTPVSPNVPTIAPQSPTAPPDVAGVPGGVKDANGPISEAPISKAIPSYPVAAINDNVEGRVVLSITILPDGTVTDVRVVEAKPSGYFEKSAVRAVQRWRYKASGITRTNVIVHVDYVLT